MIATPSRANCTDLAALESRSEWRSRPHEPSVVGSAMIELEPDTDMTPRLLREAWFPLQARDELTLVITATGFPPVDSAPCSLSLPPARVHPRHGRRDRKRSDRHYTAASGSRGGLATRNGLPPAHLHAQLAIRLDPQTVSFPFGGETIRNFDTLEPPRVARSRPSAAGPKGLAFGKRCRPVPDQPAIRPLGRHEDNREVRRAAEWRVPRWGPWTQH